MDFLIRWISTAVAAAVAVLILPGLSVVGSDSTLVPLLVFSLVLALINASLKPILQLLGAPISILTLGIFYVMINAALLYLSAFLSTAVFGMGVYVSSWLSALVASIIISIVTSIVGGIMGADD